RWTSSSRSRRTWPTAPLPGRSSARIPMAALRRPRRTRRSRAATSYRSPSGDSARQVRCSSSRATSRWRARASWRMRRSARGVGRNRGVGYWQATFEGRNEVTDSALTELLHQIDRIRTEAIPDSELTAAKGFLVGSFPLTIETPRQIAQVVSTARLLGLGTDYVQRYRERLAAVSPARARAAAQRTI